jgi:Na+/proline symporter
MLVTFVVLYLLVTIGIGLIAARRVHGAKDYLVAGRSLPLYMNVATVFATWFGAETVLSVSATFAKDGLHGVPGDPFGASVCLVLAALLFARLFYRLNLLTIGDFYKVRYGKAVEVLTSGAIVLSYLGWTSAQLTALGLVIHVLSGGAVELNTAIAALGMKTSFKDLVAVGWRPVGLMVAETAWIFAVVVLAVLWVI